MEQKEIRVVGSLDIKKIALQKAVRYIIQSKIADEVWYESRINEEKLRGCLNNVENEFVEYISKVEEDARKDERERVIQELFGIEKDKWNDAEHCTCLGYALVKLSGGEDSKGGQEMEKRLKGLDNNK